MHSPARPRSQPSAGFTDDDARAPVVVIGAGPVGLAAAAYLIERGLDPIVCEAGHAPGANIATWAHVRMFSSWRANIDAKCVSLLKDAGWQAPPLDAYPTGGEFLEAYVRPLARVPVMAARIRCDSRVVVVRRKALRIGDVFDPAILAAPFAVAVVDGAGRAEEIAARAVIDASGTWAHPNSLGADGAPAAGECAAAERIRYGMPDILGRDRARYVGRRILVAGSGYSTLGNLLSCSALIDQDRRTRVYWALRGNNFGRVLDGSPGQLPERSVLAARVRSLLEQGRFEILLPLAVEKIECGSGGVAVHGRQGPQMKSLVVDQVIAATGARPDFAPLSKLRLDIDATLECPKRVAQLIDPRIHTCGTVKPHGAFELLQPEQDFFIVGMKSYGRAPTFLLDAGYGQVRSVAAWLCGNLEDADSKKSHPALAARAVSQS
jgi:hypothetical protein